MKILTNNLASSKERLSGGIVGRYSGAVQWGRDSGQGRYSGGGIVTIFLAVYFFGRHSGIYPLWSGMFKVRIAKVKLFFGGGQ